MAECTIGERPSGPPNGMQLVRATNRTVTQILGVSGVPSTSQPFGDGTRSIRLWSDTKMAFVFGKAGQAPPTATVLDEGFTAGATEYFDVNPGEYISVIGI